MRVIDLIKSTPKTAFSFEILPPLKGTGIEKVYADIDMLREFDPKYINITTHRSEYVYQELGNGLFQRKRIRRRPGTVAVAAAIQNKYNITVVPHMLCSGFTQEDTEPSSPNRAVIHTPSTWKNKSMNSTKGYFWMVLLSKHQYILSVMG